MPVAKLDKAPRYERGDCGGSNPSGHTKSSVIGAIFICGLFMNDNDKDLALRDKFAMEAMKALIKESDFLSDFDEKDDDEDLLEEIEKIANRSYKMAKAMRKARLAVFK